MSIKKLYLLDSNQSKRLKFKSKEEEFECIQKIKDGNDECKTQLISNNLKTIISIAKKYHNDMFKVTLSDLISEGSIALLECVYTYEKCDVPFIAYAIPSIKGHILRCIEGNFLITIPFNKKEKIRKEVNLNKKSISDQICLDMKLNQTVHFDSPVSPSFSSHSSNNLSYSEIIPNNKNITPDSAFIDDDILNTLTTKILNILPKNESDIMRYRFGIGCKKLTITQIAELYNMSKHNVTLFIKQSFLRIKNNKDIHNIKDDFSFFLDVKKTEDD